ncbi:MAG: transposase [Candidatus Micrarchaeia archaeon]|jgi:transposase
MEMRQIRGMEIARQKQVQKQKDGGYRVHSQSGDGFYHVSEDFNCTCPDAQFHNRTCKHAFAVRYYLKTEIDTPNGKVVKEKRISKPQAWAAYRQSQTNEVKMFDELLSDLVESIEEPAQDMGRPRVPLKSQAYCAIQKVYSQLSSRRAYSLYKHSESREQIGAAPSYNVVNVAMNRADLTPVLHELITLSALPLKAVETDFAIDSSGFRTDSFGQYCEEKYKIGRQHQWVKAHICTGVKTNIITAAEITDEHGGDSPRFAPLVAATAQGGFNMVEVSADKAYSSRDNYQAVKDVGGRAFIPFKSNATGKSKGTGIWRKMFLYFQLNQDEFYQHYHKRSNVESTNSMVKAKFGDKVRSRNAVARENELLCKFIAHNIVVLIHESFELGINVKFSDNLKMPS